jgi:hypothetical protein
MLFPVLEGAEKQLKNKSTNYFSIPFTPVEGKLWVTWKRTATMRMVDRSVEYLTRVVRVAMGSKRMPTTWSSTLHITETSV